MEISSVMINFKSDILINKLFVNAFNCFSFKITM